MRGSRHHEIPWLAALARGYDKRPMHAGLYVTDRCNLSCSYCGENDNSVPHPSFDDLKQRIDKISALGVTKVALAGGEPLLHPDIVEVVAYAKGKGLTVSMSTNALLLNPKLLKGIEEAGLDALQVSTDRITPSDVTKKALKLQMPALKLLRGSPIKTHLSGVISADTLDQIGDVLKQGLALGFPTELRPIHADDAGAFRVHEGERIKTLELIELQHELKRRGCKVHGTTAVLNHYRSRLQGHEPEWSWSPAIRSSSSPVGSLLALFGTKDRDPLRPDRLKDLWQWNKRKPCQNGCDRLRHPAPSTRPPLSYVWGRFRQGPSRPQQKDRRGLLKKRACPETGRLFLS